jgi:hypothetical protein
MECDYPLRRDDLKLGYSFIKHNYKRGECSE